MRAPFVNFALDGERSMAYNDIGDLANTKNRRRLVALRTIMHIITRTKWRKPLGGE